MLLWKKIYLLEQSFENCPAKTSVKNWTSILYAILRSSRSGDSLYYRLWCSYNARYLTDYVTSSSESIASLCCLNITIHQTAVGITHCLLPKRKMFTSTRITQHIVIAKCGLWFTHDRFFATRRRLHSVGASETLEVGRLEGWPVSRYTHKSSAHRH